MTQDPRNLIYLLRENVRRVIVGKDEAIEQALIALLCRGHVLIEDVPGVGKTTLAAALAKSLNCSFRRIQFTPDVMPSDITGFTMVSMKTGDMEYKPGAVMTQILLADEINRTSPKTQSSLLELNGGRPGNGGWRDHPLPGIHGAGTQNPLTLWASIRCRGTDGPFFPAHFHCLPVLRKKWTCWSATPAPNRVKNFAARVRRAGISHCRTRWG